MQAIGKQGHRKPLIRLHFGGVGMGLWFWSGRAKKESPSFGAGETKAGIYSYDMRNCVCKQEVVLVETSDINTV